MFIYTVEFATSWDTQRGVYVIMCCVLLCVLVCLRFSILYGFSSSSSSLQDFRHNPLHVHVAHRPRPTSPLFVFYLPTYVPFALSYKLLAKHPLSTVSLPLICKRQTERSHTHTHIHMHCLCVCVCV